MNNNTIAILLCTYNGSRFIQEQLDSFSTQNHANWQLFVYDDASTDNTGDIIDHYQSSVPQPVFLQRNPFSKGFCNNFLTAICTTPTDSADFFALSDQDDIWQADKLSTAITYLKAVSPNVPALYCGRTQSISHNGQALGLSPLFKRKPSFNNALVQNIAGGNTMVFNRAAKLLVTQAGGDIDVICHDWWLYLLISGAGGHIFYDPVPKLLYRQHDNNLIGANDSLRAKLASFKRVFNSEFRKRNDRNVTALNANRSLLQSENIKLLDQFIEARNSGLLKRCLQLHQAGIYRQTWMGNSALLIAALFNKV